MDEAMSAADKLPFKVTWIENLGNGKWLPRGSDDETGGGAGAPPDGSSYTGADMTGNEASRLQRYTGAAVTDSETKRMKGRR